MTSKIFIADRSVAGPADHLYLVYDVDGDPDTTSDQTIIRGGPSNFPIPTGTIELEVNKDLTDSADNLGVLESPETRNYTELSVPSGQTAASLWGELVDEANSMGNGSTYANGDLETDAKYTLFGSGINSNSVIGSLLASVNVDVYDNLPVDYVTSVPLAPYNFPELGNVFTIGSGDETIDVSDPDTNSVTDLGDGDTTIDVDGGARAGATKPLVVTADTSSGSVDTITLSDVTYSDVSFKRTSSGDLNVYIAGNPNPIMVLRGQFAGHQFDTMNIIDGGTTYTLGLSDPNDFDLEGVQALSTTASSERSDYSSAVAVVSPLVLDLDGDGVELTALSGTGAAPVYWDIDNDGLKEASAWVQSDDGLLAIDNNNNGVIDNHSELFGTATTNGFAVLSALDSNSDGQITSADTNFSKLLVWRDLNQDGVSQSNELFSLSSLGITSISLSASTVSYTIAGNQVTKQSTFTMGGTSHTIVDAWFNYDNANSVYGGAYTLNSDAALLPQLRGYGDVPDLAIAMSQDSTLLDLVAEFKDIDPSSSPDTISSAVETIMYRWAGVDGVNPATRGADGTTNSTQDIAFLEKYFGQIASDTPGGTLGLARITAVETVFREVEQSLTARLLLQGPEAAFFIDPPVYNPITDTFSGTIQPNYTALSGAMSGQSLENVFNQWHNFFTTVAGTLGMASIDPTMQTALDTAIQASDPSGHLTYANVTGATLGTNFVNTFAGTSGADLIAGFGGNDTIGGAAGNDVLLGGAGNDTLNGGAGADVIVGGDGNDTINVTTSSDVSGDVIDGGAGTDKLVIGDLTNISAISSIANVEELDLTGAANPSATLSTAELNEFSTFVDTTSSSGNIRLTASSAGTYSIASQTFTAGFVTLNGSSGNDTLIGSTNGDTLNGNAGNDTISGGDGNDTLTGGAGVDTITGGNGDDTIVLSSGDAASGETIDGGSGTDTLAVSTGTNISSDTSISNMEVLDVTGTPTASLTVASGQLDDFGTLVNGYISTGTISITAAAAGTYSLSGKTITAGTITLNGTTGNDTLTGSSNGDILNGSSGNDTLSGGDGNDSITGGAGADTISGGNGDDTILLSTGDAASGETIDGGAGTDKLSVGSGSNISSETSITNMEELDVTGTPTASLTVGSGQLDDFGTIVNAYSGTGTIAITAAAAGSYSLSGKTITAGAITLNGSSGADTLTGNSYAGTINGNAGNDTIDPNGGADTLNGGTGNDTYKLSNTYAASTVTDNDSTSGNTDVLQLGSGTADDQVWLTQSGNDLVVQIIGTSAQMTVKDWYLGSAHQVEQIKTSGGLTLTNTNVHNLVSAMASLAVPTTTTLPPSYHTALDSTIAANWT